MRKHLAFQKPRLLDDYSHIEDKIINQCPFGMIDIVFLLIIFFMVGTKFSELSEAERNISLNVPEVQTARALTAAPKKRIINVFEDGKVTGVSELDFTVLPDIS